jgi:inhibitor of KinA sporulation pathway (predicted exonuclease)
MNVLVIDCEYNQPSTKTIQIGAAVFKARTGEMLESLEVYVNPGEPIVDYITELTGITDDDVKNAISIAEAYSLLKNLHSKHKCFMNPIVWGSGVRNDSMHIYNEAFPTEESRKNNPNFMGFRVIDAKTIYQSIQMLNNKTVKGGLKKACETVGIQFEGSNHTALADAVNTFRIWHKLTKCFSVKDST